MLIRRSERDSQRRPHLGVLATQAGRGLDRRTFLRHSGLAASGLAALGGLSLDALRRAEAGAPPAPRVPVDTRKSICTHCSVGCTVTAEVQSGVWIGQEPSWNSPINR
ncbi:MAG TPA: formate dehydrogenase, partial [Beijerinckiaceae bacterium]|nr:formate dehydrogenase [Beijerinckiaceae bacterium]